MLADIEFRETRGGWQVNTGVGLPTKKGEGFGESGPLRTAGEVWKDRGAATGAALEWMRAVLEKADRYAGATEATRAAAEQVREWIRKVQAALKARGELGQPAPAKKTGKPAPAAKKKAAKKKAGTK